MKVCNKTRTKIIAFVVKLQTYFSPIRGNVSDSEPALLPIVVDYQIGLSWAIALSYVLVEHLLFLREKACQIVAVNIVQIVLITLNNYGMFALLLMVLQR